MTVRHSLSQNQAQERIKQLFTRLQQEHRDQVSNVRQQWSGSSCSFSFTAMGFDVNGTLTIGRSTLELNGTLPWAASIFKGRIESAIRQEASKLLA